MTETPGPRQAASGATRATPARFDNIDHQVLLDRVRARIKDTKTVVLVRAFLKAGVMTDLALESASSTGTPQGGIISPRSPQL